MLREPTPLRLMAAGFVLLVASWMVILLVVIGEIAPSLVLSLGAYAASVAGLAVGMFGVMQYVRERRRSEGSEYPAEPGEPDEANHGTEGGGDSPT